MVEVGVALVLVGATMLVAEAHVPGGVLGAIGGVSLVTGAALAIAGAGGGVAVVLASVLAGAAVTALLLGVVTRNALATRRLRASSGREAMSGRTGVVRNWDRDRGQVLVDGALWQARPSFLEEGAEIGVGDPVVVERVSGLTLAVRPAEEWEEPW
jgi:membrane-bound serine protease (ClpP class)